MALNTAADALAEKNVKEGFEQDATASKRKLLDSIEDIKSGVILDKITSTPFKKKKTKGRKTKRDIFD